jgi:hypothetical protein
MHHVPGGFFGREKGTTGVVLVLLFFLGGLSLAFAAAAVVLIVRLRRKRLVTQGDLLLWTFAGVLFGCLAAGIRWHYSPTERILGFPFPAVEWELRDGLWRSTVDFGSIGIMGLNFLIGFMVPAVFGLVLLVRRTRRKERLPIRPPDGTSRGTE